MTIKLPKTVADLEGLLSKKEYQAPKRLQYSRLKGRLREGVFKMDGVVTWGPESITLFDDLLEKFERIPTATEYIQEGLVMMEAYWRANKYTHPKIEGYPFTKGVKLGCADRLLRTYLSKIVELHTKLLLKSMGFKVQEHPLLDAVMGVDLVVENHKKRYYLHITTAKTGESGAIRSVRRKENRGHFMVDGRWVNYTRDFTGDAVLFYPQVPNTGIAKMINGMPVLTKDYLTFYFDLKDISGKHGEPLDASPSKLDKFCKWAEVHLGKDIKGEL